jgi:hypothetical protein
MGAEATVATVMIERPNFSASAPQAAANDWLDQLLARDVAEHAGDYLPDEGFSARVMRTLPPADAPPAWRRPVVGALWIVAAAVFATMLPGTALDVARGAFRLFAAQPFSLSTIALALGAMGIATWTGAAMVLRRD